MKPTLRILICPLDWGLGHASRCIPIIEQLLLQQHEVVIGAAGAPLLLLRKEFPTLSYVDFPGFSIRYSKQFLWLKIGVQLPRIIFESIREHRQLRKICSEHKIDVVISDNRFACWNPAIKSIFISHQLFIRAPFFEGIIRTVNFWCMKHYQRIWIPDLAGEKNFSGQLAHGKNIPSNAEYIGLLSRFKSEKNKQVSNFTYDVCILLSGPEPQRTLLEDLLVTQIRDLNLRTIVVRGIPGENKKLENTATIIFENHLASKDLQQAIESSKIVVCRSGYSSIMDLARLGKKAIFIPTPGQTEQEYLAEYFMHQKVCFMQHQAKINLAEAIAESVNYRGFERNESALNLLL